MVLGVDLAISTRDGADWTAIAAMSRGPDGTVYVREALTMDPKMYATYRRSIRDMVGSIKTPNMRAAYMAVIDELEKGQGMDRLRKKLQIAFHERMRHHAQRIAHNELARAHFSGFARQIMDDDTIEAVKWRMSASHPEVDICDVLANQDLWGLGPGIYPKEHAPQPPAHPFCRCVLHARRAVKVDKAKFNAKAQAQYLSKIARTSPSKAARMAGSKAKLEEALKGRDVVDIANQNRPTEYHLRLVGQMTSQIQGNMPGQQQVASATLKMMDDVSEKMLSGLLARADNGRKGADLLRSVFSSDRAYSKHLKKRIIIAEVDSAEDYAAKTFAVLSEARSLVIAEATDQTRASTGKMRLTDGSWIVLLGERGDIITSYPFKKEKVSFEQRHMELGDTVYEQSITNTYRKLLARVFGSH